MSGRDELAEVIASWLGTYGVGGHLDVAAADVADAIRDKFNVTRKPTRRFPCGHERDPQTTRHTCAAGEFVGHLFGEHHKWTIIGGDPTAHCQCGATMNVPVAGWKA